jgi:uncharacterized membrane protein
MVKGQEQIAALINRVGALEKETNRLRTANEGLAKSTDTVIRNGVRYNNALDAQSKALRQSRQGTQMAMMQVNDFFTSVSTGASPVQAFNQQIGQLGYSLSLMGGIAGRVGQFLAGPWGLLVLGASTAIGLFAKNTKDAGDKSIDFAATATNAFDSVANRLETALKPAIENLQPALAVVGEAFGWVYDAAIAFSKGALYVINRLIGGIIGVVNAATVFGKGLMASYSEMGIGVVNFFARVVNNIAKGIEQTVNAARPYINSMLEFLGSSYRIAELRLGRLEEKANKFAGSTANTFRDAGKAFMQGFNTDIIDFSDMDVKYKSKEGKGKGGAGDRASKEKSDADKAAKIAESLAKHKAKWEQYWAKTWTDLNDEVARNDAENMADRQKGLAALAETTQNQYVKPIDDALEQLAQSYERVGQSVSDAFKGMLLNGASFKDGMRGIISAVIDELWRLYVVQSIVGMVGRLLGSATTGGMVAGVTAGNAQAAAAFFKPKANGGGVQQGQRYLVGERGPEWFVPGGSGTIIPNRNSDMASGGGGVTIHVDARGSADPAAVREQVQRGIIEAAPSIIAAAEARTITSLRRPRLGGAIQ